MNICVYCASSDKVGKIYKEAGEKFGEEMAKRNHTLVFGCGAFGVMAAVARGTKNVGGKRIGVVPEFIKDFVAVDTECDEVILTETMRQRKQIMEERSDAFVMLPGGIGTFEEFFEILTLKQLQQHQKPVAVYNVNNYYKPFIDMLETAIDQDFMSPESRKIVFFSDDIEEILDYIENYKPETYNKLRY